jgi:phosphoenolpyruvate synthase/pyruvate phosphate dikinase
LEIFQKGSPLVAAKRLDNVQQIFDLTLEDLKEATTNQIDLRIVGASNRQFADRLRAVSVLPSIFDSRGHILRPKPVPPKEGEVAGTPISPGIIQGRIKVLHSPDEKPLLRGEIIVARATDPGWTPLFVNAAAVILEVGGMLQHGALVAREYGLPCVSGVTNATTLWPDGTLVEIDGAAGVIRVLDKSAAESKANSGT